MMATATDFELRLAAFADLAREMRPPEPYTRDNAPPVQAALRLRRQARAQNPAKSTQTAGTVVLNRTTAAIENQYLDRSQARAICTAASFLGQAYGQCFNLFLVFHHHGDDHTSGAHTVNNFHRRARARLSYRGQATFPFVYVHEARRDGRLSTRLACRVEFDRDDEFLSWIATGFTLSRAGRLTTFEECRRRTGNKRGERVAFHHRCVLDLLRGVDPTLAAKGENGRYARLIDCLGVPTGERRSLGIITCAQRYGTADALSLNSQAAADEVLALLNAFDADAWPWLGSGWELDEHDARRAEAAVLEEERRRIDARWPASANALVRAGRAAAVTTLEARRTLPPECRQRLWPCWPLVAG